MAVTCSPPAHLPIIVVAPPHGRSRPSVISWSRRPRPGTPEPSPGSRRPPGSWWSSSRTVAAVYAASAGKLVVELEDGRGRLRSFPLGPGFMIDGKPVVLTRPAARQQPSGTKRSASGSVYVEGARARTARASRIWVEGKHDAELVQKVWGHDLRIEGVVVEMLDGADNLPERVQDFSPGPGRRLGILVDHLVPGSKESRIAAEVMRLPGAAGNVTVLGHPYVDVWQAVRPARVGLTKWPHVPKGTDI